MTSSPFSTPSTLSSRSTLAFREAAGDELLEALARDTAVVFAIDRSFHLGFFNAAWRDFALANGGDRCLEDYGLGAPLRRAIPDVLRLFYDRAFTEVMTEGKAWQHVYECSSPELIRSFRMRVALLEDRSHLVIANDLVHEAPHGARTSIDSTGYVGAGGLVVQCAHCRRCRRPGTELWDWVPAYVSEPPANVSHGFCPPCVAYHYAT